MEFTVGKKMLKEAGSAEYVAPEVMDFVSRSWSRQEPRVFSDDKSFRRSVRVANCSLSSSSERFHRRARAMTSPPTSGRSG